MAREFYFVQNKVSLSEVKNDINFRIKDTCTIGLNAKLAMTRH